MRILKPEWLQRCRMERIICHWTVTGYDMSSHAGQHYHFLFDGQGKAHQGGWDVEDNVNAGDGAAAYHTYRLNSGSIGLAALCMAGATSNNLGRYPLKEIQWQAMAMAAADLCEFYELPVTPRTVLQHGEVDNRYHKPSSEAGHNGNYYDQAGKWDINVLPWARHLSPEEVWEDFRTRVREELCREAGEEPAEPEPLNRLKAFWHPRAAEVKGLINQEPIDDFHVALQVVNGRVAAAKVTIEGGGTLRIDPTKLVAGSLEFVYE